MGFGEDLMSFGKNQEKKLQVRRLRKKGEILSYLEREHSYSATAISCLQQSFGNKWFLGWEGESFTLCLISERLFSSWVFTMGNEKLLGHLLSSLRLPKHALLTCRPEHLEPLQRIYKLEFRRSLKRMTIDRENFNPQNSEETKLLQLREAMAVNEFYRTWGRQNLPPKQLREGTYYGIWENGQLVSAAGTLFISPKFELACLGNILTRPSHRNRGLATACTSAVTSKLLNKCREVVLDVEPENKPAIRVYSKLGYKEEGFLIEALGERQISLPPPFTSLWRKLGLKSI